MAPVRAHGVRSLLWADFRANAPGLPERPGGRAVLVAAARTLPTVRFTAVALFRVGHTVGRRVRVLGSLVKQANHVLTGCDCAYQAEVGPGLVLYHPTGVVVGPDVRIGARAVLMQGVTVGSNAVTAGGDTAGSPVIGDDVFLGPGAVLFGAIQLGDRVRVGANAVVMSSFGSDVVIAGAPARTIR